MSTIDIDSFVSNFASAFEGSTYPFAPNTRFKEIPEWNSMQALYLVGMIDSEYGIEFNNTDLRSCTTIAEIFEIVQSRLQ